MRKNFSFVVLALVVSACSAPIPSPEEAKVSPSRSPTTIASDTGELSRDFNLSEEEVKAVEKLREFQSAQNAEARRRRTAYYQYLVEADRTDGKTLEEHIETYKAFHTVEKSSEDQIASLEQKAGVKLPEDLKNFYREMGAFSGRDTDSAIDFNIPNCQSLIQALESEVAYKRLYSLGISDGIRGTWGNSRPELEPGSDSFSQSDYEKLCSEYSWFGSLRDQMLESGVHFAFDRQGRYCLFYWHQDDAHSDLKPDLVFDGAFAELLGHCIDGYFAVREVEEDEEEGEDPSVSFDLEVLVLWLKENI